MAKKKGSTLVIRESNLQRLIIKLETIADNIPSLILKKYARTQDLNERYLALKDFVSLLGKSLKARFGGGGGNPAKKARNAGLIDEMDYQILQALVDWYIEIFAVIQVAWEDLEEGLRWIDNKPQTEVELFFEILRERYDSQFMACVKGQKWILEDFETRLKLTRNFTWKNMNNPDWFGELTIQDASLLPDVGGLDESAITLFPLTIAICCAAAQKDGAIRRALRRLLTAGSHLDDVLLQAVRQERTKNPPKRFRSEKWDGGSRAVGVKGGFFTNRNETISSFSRNPSQFAEEGLIFSRH